MAGGSGTRLWPISRQNKPKQFHHFIGDKSLLRETYERLLSSFKPENILVSTIGDYVEEVKRHLPEIKGSNIIVEPSLRGNAPACGLVSAYLDKIDPGASVIFIPSDHMIKDVGLFLDTISFTEKLLQDYPDHIITIGINPTKPDTDLGYIKMESQIVRDKGFSAFSVNKFIEKPTLEKAEQYLSSWEYLWNSGMFIWKVDEFLRKMEKYMPETYQSIMKIKEVMGTEDEKKIAEIEYKKVEKTSVDYGILEKTNDLMVVPGDFGWSDVGTWGSLLDFFGEVHNTNVITKGNHIGLNNEDCLILSNDKLIATLGLKDVVIVDSPDALLICDRSKSKDVKALLDKLKEEGKYLYL
jgi:mannose-1-phosphate guanylyltransferase